MHVASSCRLGFAQLGGWIPRANVPKENQVEAVSTFINYPQIPHSITYTITSLPKFKGKEHKSYFFMDGVG